MKNVKSQPILTNQLLQKNHKSHVSQLDIDMMHVGRGNKQGQSPLHPESATFTQNRISNSSDSRIASSSNAIATPTIGRINSKKKMKTVSNNKDLEEQLNTPGEFKLPVRRTKPRERFQKLSMAMKRRDTETLAKILKPLQRSLSKQKARIERELAPQRIDT